MVEAVFVTDADGAIVLSNQALVKMLGHENVLGRTATDVIQSDALRDALDAALEGLPQSVQIETKTPAEEARTLSAQVAPLPEGGGVVVVLHDVSELKRADKVRRDFVANASHELRTPLTAIRGFAETLRDGALDDPATSRKFLERILEHTQRLQTLIEDLLQLSRAESPEIAFERKPIDVRAAFANVLRGLEPQARAKNISITVDGTLEEPEIYADARGVDQVLVNLVENAVKYTPANGHVTIRTSLEGKHVVIEVSDTGPGIPPAQLTRIFERFYRVDPGRARDVGGTGLGLAIVKHLMQRMLGEVTAESRVGQGTTFRLRFARVLD